MDIRKENEIPDQELDRKLRPLTFDDFTGQSSVVENLRIFVAAAKMRSEPLDHTLLYGPPGLGKTTLSAIIANQLGVNMKTTSGPVIDKPGDLAGLLTSLEPNDVLFIDEIHRLSPVVEEYLYSAMEDFKIDDDSCKAIALRSRGTPRIANSLLRRVRDFAQVIGDGHIMSELTAKSLNALNIDEFGLDEQDIKILLTIIDKFGGGPVGVSTIATAVGEDPGTIEDVYEPYLIQSGFIKRTPRGRVATPLAYKHTGRTGYKDDGPNLFDFASSNSAD